MAWNWRRTRKAQLATRQKRLKFLSFIATIVFFGVIFSFLMTVGLFAWYAKDLPRPDRVARTSGFSTIIYDRSGQVLYDVYGDQNRVPVSFEELSLALRQATIAVEDKDFYKHQGFDPRGMLRAVFNIVFKHKLEGGSTLTQQLVKNALLTSERTLPRKIKEFILSVQIERNYSKDQIMQMYLNEAPYGGTSWGVETAAQNYFGKKAKDLNLTESVILAGLPASPTYYSPFGQNPKAYIDRSEHVLRRMQEEGYITKKQEAEITSELPNIQFSQYRENIKAPHFVMMVKQQLVDQFDEKLVEQGGLRVTTTLDWKIQEEAQKIVAEEVEKAKGLKVGNGAAVVLDPKTGEILAMVGSKDYFVQDYDGNVNVTLSLRQPGSAIKPFTYATAFKKGYTPSALLMDVKTVFPGGHGLPDYIPENYDGKFHGPVQVRFALGNSINIPAVKMLAMVGVRDMLETAYESGLHTLEPTTENLQRFGLAITLGGGEVRLLDLTSAYGVLASGGIRQEPASILKVTDKDGKVLFEKKSTKGKRVLAEEVAFLISHILSDNNSRLEVFGPNSWLVIPGKTVSVKTGTTDDKKDNWTVGYTPSYAVGVWVGNNDNSSMNEKLASGVSGAAPIWNRIMREILKNKPDERPAVPDNVVAVTIDAFAGGLPKDGFPTRAEYYIKGTEPTSVSPVYQKLKISKNNGKLANPIEIASGSYDEKDFFVFKEDDPVSGDGINRWQQAIDDWLKTVGDDKYHPPTEMSDSKKDEIIVSIHKPDERARYDDYDVEVNADAKALKTIVRMVLEVDDQEKRSWAADTVSERVNFTKGPHKIRIKAIDQDGNEGAAERRIGIFCPWDGCPLPTSTPLPTPTFTPTPTP